MRHVFFVLSLEIIALGAIHLAATPRFFSHLTGAALWFASGGLAIILTGTLNLLRRAYGGKAPGLRWVCVMTNVVMTSFALFAGYTSHASAGQFVLAFGLLEDATIFSLLSAAQRRA